MEQTIFDTEFFEKLNTLKLSINMRLNKGMSGGRKSSAKGTSVEFSDFREYVLGDDVRRIDWNAYGRMDKLYIKQFMEEKEGVFNIFVDTSKSMEYGEIKKSYRALQLAGALSYIILNNLDRVYVTQVKDSGLTVGKGVTGRSSYKKVMRELESIRFDGETTLSKAIKSRDITKRGVSIIISDFLDPNGVEDAIKYLLYKKQEIILIQVLAREEVDIDVEGTVNLQDMETGEEMKITVTKQVIDSYNKELQGLNNRLNMLSRKYNMIYLSTVSDESFDKVLFEGFKNTGVLL